jgi:hypothetical protein
LHFPVLSMNRLNQNEPATILFSRFVRSLVILFPLFYDILSFINQSET